MKIITIVGARPQFIKSAAISRAFKAISNKATEIIVHTGQHYDAEMSSVFFEQMHIPKPAYNLAVGSGAHGKQTASMIEGIEQILLNENPSAIIIYGDTNSTLAAAIAASKLDIPIIHIEAGLRSYNKSMPEEINRILSDHVSTLLFVPTQAGITNLLKEGFDMDNQPPYNKNNPKVIHCGDIMYDNSLFFSQNLGDRQKILSQLGLKEEEYVLCTIHRNNNTDSPERMTAIFEGLFEIAKDRPIVLPIHPRTQKMLETYGNLKTLILQNPNIRIISPLGFIEMTVLESAANMIVTDSGGVQKESYFFQKPCIILRPETEWIEIVELQTAILADADTKAIIEAYKTLNQNRQMLAFPPIFGDGKAAEFIVEQIVNYLS